MITKARSVSCLSTVALVVVAGVASAVDPTAHETVVGTAAEGANDGFEPMPLLAAKDFLSEAELEGPDYQVGDEVVNDGLMNHYVVNATRGRLDVEGTEYLLVRLSEIAALERLEAIKETSTYGDAFAAAAKSPYHAAKALVTEPVQTVKRVGAGVGRFLGSVGHAVAGKPTEQEDGAVKTALGFDVYKRNVAYEAGVDPYTSYAPLVERLNELAWTGFAGGITVRALFIAVPGPIGTTLQATSFSEGMRQLVRDKSPSELKKHNSDVLVGMKLDKVLVGTFLDNPKLSPTMGTRIVSALATMNGVGGREVVVARATLVQDETEAFYRARQAEMIAAYHERVGKIERIVPVGRGIGLRRKDGTIVIVFPGDYLAWTEDTAAGATAASSGDSPLVGAKTKELWLAGGASPRARSALESEGWKVVEGARATLQ